MPKTLLMRVLYKLPKIFFLPLIFSFYFTCSALSYADTSESQQQAVVQSKKEHKSTNLTEGSSDFITVKSRPRQEILDEAQQLTNAGKYDEAIATYNYLYDITRDKTEKKDILEKKADVEIAAANQEREQKLAQEKADRDAKRQADLAKKEQLKKERDQKLADQKAAAESKRQAEAAKKAQLQQEREQKLAQEKADRDAKRQADLAKKEQLKKERDQKQEQDNNE